jgi:hypothetical protein
VTGFSYGQSAEIIGDNYVYIFATTTGMGTPFSRAVVLRNAVSEMDIASVQYAVPYDFQYLFNRSDNYLWTTFAENKFLFNSIRSRDNMLIGITVPKTSVERYNFAGGDAWMGTISPHSLASNTLVSYCPSAVPFPSGSAPVTWAVSGASFNYFAEGTSENITHNDLNGIAGGYINMTITKMRNVMDEDHAVVHTGITHTPIRYYGADLFDTVFLYGYDHDAGHPIMEAVSKWYFYSKHDVKTGLFDIHINNFKFGSMGAGEIASAKNHIEGVIRDTVWMIKPITSELRYVVWNNSN